MGGCFALNKKRILLLAQLFKTAEGLQLWYKAIILNLIFSDASSNSQHIKCALCESDMPTRTKPNPVDFLLQ